MDAPNYFAARFNQEYITDLVIMNDELCLHDADFGIGVRKSAFCAPYGVIIPETDTTKFSAKISCPVCTKKYPEATKKLKKDYLKWLASLSESSILDEVTV